LNRETSRLKIYQENVSVSYSVTQFKYWGRVPGLPGAIEIDACVYKSKKKSKVRLYYSAL